MDEDDGQSLSSSSSTEMASIDTADTLSDSATWEISQAERQMKKKNDKTT